MHDKEYADQIMAALLSNPLGLKIERSTPNESEAAVACVREMVAHYTFSKEETESIKHHSKQRKQSVNQVIQAAQIMALQLISPVPKENQVRTHTPSGIINVLPRTTLLSGEKIRRHLYVPPGSLSWVQ